MSDFQKRFVVCVGLLVVAMVFLCAMTEFDKTNLMIGAVIFALFPVAVLLYEPLAPYCRKLRDTLKQPGKDGEKSEEDKEDSGANVDEDAKKP